MFFDKSEVGGPDFLLVSDLLLKFMEMPFIDSSFGFLLSGQSLRIRYLVSLAFIDLFRDYDC